MKANNYQFTNENDLINLLSKLNNEKNYYNVYSSLENIFSENWKMFQKETSEIFTVKINDSIINGSNHYLKLAWFMLVENKIDIIPTVVIEKCFIDNSIITKMIIDILHEIYRSKNDNENEKRDFQLPSTQYFINLIFKLPVIITNYFELSFINHSHYYECLFKNVLLFRIDLLEDNIFISKIFSLKLFEILYKCITNNSFDETIHISLMEIIQRNELFKEEFIKRLFHFHSIVNKSQFIQISRLYKLVNSFNCLNKIDKIIKRNNFFLTLVLISKNNQLQNNCFSSIIKIMKNQTRSLFEDIEIYGFYIVFFFIYYILETCHDLEMLDVFDNLVKICFIILENVSDKNKKGIVQIFMNYLYQQMHQYLKLKNSKSELQEIEIDEVYNKEQINVVNFQNTRKLFDNDSFSLNSSINENDFKIKFYSIIIKTPYSIIQKQLLLKQSNHKEENQKQLPNKQNKVIYKSIKFQKKYGTFEKKKYLEIKENTNNSILNITGNNKENKFDNDDDEKITLPFDNLVGKNKLKISLNKNDDYNDLKKMKPPEHIKDCILGLNSQFKDRQELSLRVLPSLIESQPLDLDFHLNDLANSLLRIENNFDIEEFESLLKLSLVNLTKFNPSKLTLILCERFFSNDNCGLKNKFFILDIINKAVEEISQYYYKTPNNKKNKKGRANVFHPYFLNVIFPLLNYLKIQKIEFLITFDTFDLLLAKFLFIIANILKVSENHPVVYKALFETFELFKAITKVKILLNCKSHSLLEAMNAYVDVSLDFYKENFIMVYPDILENYKNAIKYLNSLLDTKELNEDLRLRILQTLHKYTIQVDKFKESYFGISQDKNDVVDSIGVKFASQLLV